MTDFDTLCAELERLEHLIPRLCWQCGDEAQVQALETVVVSSNYYDRQRATKRGEGSSSKLRHYCAPCQRREAAASAWAPNENRWVA